MQKLDFCKASFVALSIALYRLRQGFKDIAFLFGRQRPGEAAANETRVPYISDTALRNGSGAIERDQDWDDSGLECYL